MTIEELKKALEAATPGPWEWYHDKGGDYGAIQLAECWMLRPGVLIADATDGTPGGDAIDRANARLIVEAVNNLPKLLKVVEAAQTMLVTFELGCTEDAPLRTALEELNDD